MRIGLFGGSFNPIHFGHLRAAEEDREAMALDLVYFIPAGSPPHKSGERLAPADHRLQMARLATKGNRHFMVSDVEVRRGGRSYTIDTVRHLLTTMKGRPELYLMIGGDQFAELDTWKEAEELTRLCNFVVHTRPASDDDGSRDSLAAVERFGYICDDEHYVHPSGHTLTFVPTTFFPVSATLIRRKITERKSIRYLLPDDVADYIQRHDLY
jgi:nicotinate-nucleotide adenylyltransferase